MNLKELHSDLCALGFEDYLPFDASFLSSTRRALIEIYTASAITKSVKFLVRRCLPNTQISEFNHKGGGTEVLPLNGVALSMRLYGKGSFRVNSSKGGITKSFDCDGDYFKCFIGEGASLTLLGELSYTILGLACFGEVFSDRESDIPDGDGVQIINARERLADFLAFADDARDLSGEKISGISLSDGKIIIPPDFSGEINLTYRKLPIVPTLDSPDADIDIPSSHAPLLPLLTASYYLLDDEVEKAGFYRDLYEKNLKIVLDGEKKMRESSGKYEVYDRWA